MTTETNIPTPSRHRSAEDWIARLPDGPVRMPDARVLGRIAGNPARFRGAVIADLRDGLAKEKPAFPGPSRGYRGAYLVSLLGEWRDAEAVPTLITALDTTWSWGWDELIHAFTRIGGHAVDPLLAVLSAYTNAAPEDRAARTSRVRRAVRALASIGLAACDYGDYSDWVGDADAQYREICAALADVLVHEATPADVRGECAERLCELRWCAAWDTIDAMFTDGRIPYRDGFDPRTARQLMNGHLIQFDLGAWRMSLIDWLVSVGA